MCRKDCYREVSSHRGYRYCWLLVILWSMLLTALPSQATEKLSPSPPSSVSVSLHNGYLSARVVAIPLQQVMQELSRVSGAQIIWRSPPGEQRVSVSFSALPLAEAIQRIVGAHNFLLIFSSTADTARLMQIWLSAPLQSQAHGTTQPRSSVLPIGMERAAPPTVSDVAKAEERARLDNALEAVTQPHDVATHLVAIKILAPYVRDDPQVRVTLSQLAQSNEDSQVQAAVAAALREE